MLLDLIFESSDEHTQPAEAQTFKLYERGGRYLLPDVVLVTEPGARPQVRLQGIRVTVESDAADRGQLRHVLESTWRPPATPGWVTARAVLSTGVAVGVTMLDFAFRTSQGAPVRANVAWTYVYTGEEGEPVERTARTSLVFMRPGVAPPKRPARPVDPDAVRYGVPAALPRPILENGDHPGFAAVDFGYSSSTVTIFDHRDVGKFAIDPAQAARLGAELADLIEFGPADTHPELSTAWDRQRELLLEEIRDFDESLRGMTQDAVVKRLRGGPAMANGVWPLLDAVCTALETRLTQAGGPLRAWLAPRLLDAHENAFTVPPLREMFLRQVVFDDLQGTREIPSLVTPRPGEPITVTLGEDGPEAIRGLKSKLLKPEPLPGRTGQDGREANSLDLIAHALLRLVEHAERFAHKDSDGRPRAIRRLVVTYPTVTPPGARERLERIADHTLRMDLVTTDFDEGVAAGLFFMLRDFGSNRREFGVEAMRARSVKIADDPPTWRQHMLVLDIGAGTTDIALIRLTLTDMTEPADTEPGLAFGRYYVIKPEVLNSTGDPQLGGDFMTLRVFYWIKAAIVDTILAGRDENPDQADRREQLRNRVFPNETEPFSLAEAVLNSGAEAAAPPGVRAVLRSVIPTNWKDNPDATQNAFQLLWRLAEDVKIALSGDTTTFTISNRTLSQIIPTSAEELLPLLPADGIELRAADLDRLVRPVLTEAVKLATWLVDNTLGADESLDRVMLSGKPSKMPLLKQVVVEELGRLESDDAKRNLEWNRSAVTVEAEYAKQAASIGACWAHSVRDRAAAQVARRDEMAKGRTQILLDVDNLGVTLPCSLHLAHLGSDVEVLLEAGAPLVRLSSETIGARSPRWVDMMANFQVNRPLRTDFSIGWGVFNYPQHAVREGLPANREMYAPAADGSRGARVKAELEVDQTLKPYLNLCQGRPHYHIPSDGEIIELRQALADEYWHDVERRLRELPAAVWVTGAPGQGEPHGVERELFPIWSPSPDDDVTTWFTEFFRETDDAAIKPRPGRLSAPLPPPPEDGRYVFFLRWPNGDRTPLGPLEAPGERGPMSRYVASLDVRGNLALHVGMPPYWKADSLREVEQFPGKVYRVAMDNIESPLNPERDPFTGRH